jgi:hypothetical protein
MGLAGRKLGSKDTKPREYKVDILENGNANAARNGQSRFKYSQETKEKAVNFAVQHLVIVLPRTAIVNNMNEAYTRIEASTVYFQEYKFGTFISGPSKTADIEGALVYGAQAARALTVILTP